MDAVDEVKSRLNVEDVVAEYIQLKRSGRNFKGLSPWTNEKTPSFMVSPEKQIWHDFSSGRGGDIFTLVMEMEGLDFRGALEHLAAKAGVELEDYKTQNGHRKEYKDRVFEALALATKFYQKQLIANKLSLNYLLKERGFARKTLIDWQLGYAPKAGRALSDFLAKKGFDTNEMKRAGLTFMRAGGPGDMFRGRITIPLCDSQGRVIGFTARLLADEPNAPKYINTPQTIVYDKGRHVFGLHLAKESVRKHGFVIIVEGNMDVIASHQAGIKNVVATAGTAMTDNHLRELKRFTSDVRMCFDADSAGISATERAITIAQRTGVNLSVIMLKDAKDPDELIRKDPKQWQLAVRTPTYVVDWLMNRYAAELDLKTATGKKSFTDILLGIIRLLGDAVEQDHYLKQLASLTDTNIDAIYAKFSTEKVERPPLRKTKTKPDSVDPNKVERQRLQDHLLSMALMQPKVRPVLADIKPKYFTNEASRKILEFLNKHPDFKDEPQLAKELQEVSDYVKILVLQFEELYDSLSLDDLREQAQSLKHRLIASYVKIQKLRLIEKMQSTSNEHDLKKLIQEVDNLNKLIVKI